MGSWYWIIYVSNAFLRRRLRSVRKILNITKMVIHDKIGRFCVCLIQINELQTPCLKIMSLYFCLRNRAYCLFVEYPTWTVSNITAFLDLLVNRDLDIRYFFRHLYPGKGQEGVFKYHLRRCLQFPHAFSAAIILSNDHSPINMAKIMTKNNTFYPD